MGTTDLANKPFAVGDGTEYSAKDARRVIFQNLGQGVLAPTDYAVSQRAAGANMSVDVAAGEALIEGDTTSDQGRYYCRETATTNVSITAADGSNPRIDRVVLEILDNDEDSSGAYKGRIRTVDGTPTAAATLTNLNGAATVPDDSLLLANVLIAAGDTSITDAEIDTNVGNIRAVALPRLTLPYCRMYANAAYSMANGFDFVQFDTEHYDTLGNLGNINSDNAITLRAPGRWQVNACLQWAVHATGYRMAQILTDQTTAWASHQVPSASASVQNDMPISAVVVSTGSTVVNLRGYQSSGGALNAEAGLSDTFIEAYWIGPT
jgi:hypothetical protein